MLARLRSWFPPTRPLAALTSLLPTSCALCGAEAERAICADCAARFLLVQGARCRQCAIPLNANATHCGRCLEHPPRFDASIAACHYTAPLDRLVLALKFGHRLELAPVLGAMLAEAVQDLPLHERPSLLAPVPLGPRRLAERGFNQALELARPLSRALQVALDARLLRRTRETGPQSLLHPDERRVNVAGAFAVREDAALDGLHLGLVDDVMTTGETLNAAAAALKRHGAARVTCFVFARTLTH